MANYSAFTDLSDTTMTNFSWNDDNLTQTATYENGCERNDSFRESVNTIRLVCEVYLSLPIAGIGILGNIVSLAVLCNRDQRLQAASQTSNTIIGNGIKY